MRPTSRMRSCRLNAATSHALDVAGNYKVEFMDYSEKIFGKTFDQLTRQDIVDFFSSPKEESDIIEYKSFFERGQNNYNHKEKAILKSICAFLNSNGGIIIWGAPVERKDSDGNKHYEGELSPVDRLIKKDSFIAKIANKIIPVPDNINMTIIPCNEGKSVCVFEIQESEYKPHQFDDRYWMRLDGQTKTAPHHYVEALFRQIKYPNLGGYLKVERIIKQIYKIPGQGFEVDKEYLWLTISIAIFNFSKLQNEEKVSYRLISDPGRFEKYYTPGHMNLYKMKGSELRMPKAKEILHYGEPIIDTYSILIKPDQLIKNHYKLDLYLFFGGRYSPQKRSTYSLDLRKIEMDNYNKLFVQIIENKLASEEKEELGVSDQDSVKFFLGR